LFDAQRRQTWEPSFGARSLADSRALVAGYGSIGEAIGARLRASEVQVDGVAHSARTAPDGTVVYAVEDLPSALPEFDIVIVVAPHTDETDKLVDTEVLLAELESTRLFAALDVTDPEPLPTGHPLWSAPQCIIVPHVAGGEPVASRRFVALVRAQIDVFRSGIDPLNAVNSEAL